MQEKLEMINVKQTSILPLRAAHLYEWLYNSHNVSASLQHLTAGSTRWLLRAVNTYIGTLVWLLPAPLPVAFIPSLPFSGKFCSPCACLLRIIAGWRTVSFLRAGFFPRRESASKGADDIAGIDHAEMCLCSASLCSYTNQQRFLHQLYTRWQHNMQLCLWAGFKYTNIICSSL